MTKRAARGTNSCKSPSRFAPSSPLMELTPVTLPPGRLRLATRPVWTGSPPPLKTIGMVEVADLAADAAAVLPTERIAHLSRDYCTAGFRSAYDRFGVIRDRSIYCPRSRHVRFAPNCCRIDAARDLTRSAKTCHCPLPRACESDVALPQSC